MLWRFRGTPHYLGQQAGRLGVTPVLADRARNNQEIYRVSVLLAQLCERYHKARKEDGRPVLAATELAQVRGTLAQAEQEASKLHMLAATAAAMIDDAYLAFETEQPTRHFAVLCDFDTPSIPLPVGDGTVGVD
jgi:phage terminase Nu1 subunit (DNA packaging protein)